MVAFESLQKKGPARVKKEKESREHAKAWKTPDVPPARKKKQKGGGKEVSLSFLRGGPLQLRGEESIREGRGRGRRTASLKKNFCWREESRIGRPERGENYIGEDLDLSTGQGGGGGEGRRGYQSIVSPLFDA